MLCLHQIELAEANAMLARDRAAHPQRAFTHAVANLAGLFHLCRVVRLDQQNGVEIAIPHMAKDRPRQAGRSDVGAGFRHRLREPRDRHAHIRD